MSLPGQSDKQIPLGLWIFALDFLLLAGLLLFRPVSRGADPLAEARSQPRPAHVASPPASAELPAETYLTHLALVVAGVPTSDTQSQPAPSIPDRAEEKPFHFAGIDFSPGSQPITLRIRPPNKRLNGGEPLEITFTPGETCTFGTGTACVYTYRTPSDVPVIHLTIHSGVGGEAQAFRHLLEGTGLNRALYPLVQVNKNMRQLHGAKVVLRQGKRSGGDLELSGLGRLPPQRMAAYFTTPIEEALIYAAEDIPEFSEFINPRSPLLVFETCGWKMPGEPWSQGVSATSGSIYLAVIQE